MENLRGVTDKKPQCSHPDSLVINYAFFLFPQTFCKEFLGPAHKVFILTQLH